MFKHAMLVEAPTISMVYAGDDNIATFSSVVKAQLKRFLFSLRDNLAVFQGLQSGAIDSDMEEWDLANMPSFLTRD